jgi:hypothetical protein
LGIAIYYGRKRKKEGEEKESLKQTLLRKGGYHGDKKNQNVRYRNDAVVLWYCWGSFNPLFGDGQGKYCENRIGHGTANTKPLEC